MRDDVEIRAEHAAWVDLCEALLALGAVTRADLDSPVSAHESPGQRLLALARHWGALYARLAIMHERKV